GVSAGTGTSAGRRRSCSGPPRSPVPPSASRSRRRCRSTPCSASSRSSSWPSQHNSHGGRGGPPRILERMTEHDEIWLPLVDEPIGGIVAQIQADDPEIERLVGSPRRILAFKTFAYIRAGVKLGELLVESDLPPY